MEAPGRGQRRVTDDGHMAEFRDRELRAPVDFDGTVIDSSGQHIKARIGNLSRNGFCGSCSGTLRIGSLVTIILPELGPKEAQIRWALGPRFGATFRK